MPHHLEYIKIAISCFESMVNDIPATLGLNSIQRVLQAVENALAHGDGSSTTTPIGEQGAPPFEGLQTPTSAISGAPSTDQQHVYFTDLWNQDIAGVQNPVAPGWEFQTQDVNFDVMTTDLLHFFAPDGGHPGKARMM